MSQEDLGKLKQYFNEIYPHVWEHYKFLFDRRTDTRKIEFILTFESLLTLAFISLFSSFILDGNLLFIIPLLLFLTSIFISLYGIVPIFIWFPWFEKENLKRL